MSPDELILFRQKTFDECIKIAAEVYATNLINPDHKAMTKSDGSVLNGANGDYWPKVRELGFVLRLHVEDPHFRTRPIHDNKELIQTRLDSLRFAIDIMKTTGAIQRTKQEFLDVAKRIMEERTALRNEAMDYLRSDMATNEHKLECLNTRTNGFEALSSSLLNWRETWIKVSDDIDTSNVLKGDELLRQGIESDLLEAFQSNPNFTDEAMFDLAPAEFKAFLLDDTHSLSKAVALDEKRQPQDIQKNSIGLQHPIHEMPAISAIEVVIEKPVISRPVPKSEDSFGQAQLPEATPVQNETVIQRQSQSVQSDQSQLKGPVLTESFERPNERPVPSFRSRFTLRVSAGKEQSSSDNLESTSTPSI